jgi:hypothetical protein
MYRKKERKKLQKIMYTSAKSIFKGTFFLFFLIKSFFHFIFDIGRIYQLDVKKILTVLNENSLGQIEVSRVRPLHVAKVLIGYNLGIDTCTKSLEIS